MRILIPITILVTFICFGLYLDVETTINLESSLNPPDKNRVFGTDQLGRDLAPRVLSAGLRGLYVSFSAWFVALVLGVVIGFAAAAAPNRSTRQIASFAIRIPFVIPVALVLICLASFFGYSAIVTIVVISLMAWAWPARVCMTQYEFIAQSNAYKFAVANGMALGWRARNIILPMLIPALLASSGPLLVEIFAIDIVVSIFGFNVSPDLATFGNLLKDGFLYFNVAPWMMWIPVFTIAVLCISLRYLFEKVASYY